MRYGSPLQLAMEIEEVSSTFEVMKNLIWTQVDFAIILQNAKSKQPTLL